MEKRKIIAWHVIKSEDLDDYYPSPFKFEKTEKVEGLNSQAKKLINDGFVPFGPLQLHTVIHEGTNGFKGIFTHYTKEFVKYE